jgi:hypothetical protein
MLVGAIIVKYSTVHITVHAEAAKINQVTDQLSQNAVITGVEGPTQDRINSLKAIIPDKSNVTILCGFMGILVGLAGVFIDTLLGMFETVKERIIKKGKE